MTAAPRAPAVARRRAVEPEQCGAGREQDHHGQRRGDRPDGASGRALAASFVRRAASGARGAAAAAVVGPVASGGGASGGACRHLPLEMRDVAALGNGDAHRIALPASDVVAVEIAPQPPGLEPNHRIGLRIEGLVRAQRPRRATVNPFSRSARPASVSSTRKRSSVSAPRARLKRRVGQDPLPTARGSRPEWQVGRDGALPSPKRSVGGAIEPSPVGQTFPRQGQPTAGA